MPRQRDYDRTNLGIMVAPEHLMYDGFDVTAWEKYERAVRAEWAKYDALVGAE